MCDDASMRAGSTLVALLAIASCATGAGCLSDPHAPPAADESLAPFAPLAGTWRAAEAKPGDRVSWTEETWSVPAGNSMIGTSRTLGHGDWSGGEFEFLRIVSRPDGVFYLASPQGRMPPTEFRLQRPWPSSKVRLPFEFVNEKHDFPQRVVYRFESDDELEVTISAGGDTVDGAASSGRSLTWHFERVK